MVHRPCVYQEERKFFINLVVTISMDMKFGINKTNLSKAFIARDKEIFADSRNREKKKKSSKVLKKKSTKVSYKSLFEDFHRVDLIG